MLVFLLCFKFLREAIDNRFIYLIHVSLGDYCEIIICESFAILDKLETLVEGKGFSHQEILGKIKEF